MFTDPRVDNVIENVSRLTKATGEDITAIIDALRLAGIHAATCEKGQAIARQKVTEMWIDPDREECNCWVEN